MLINSSLLYAQEQKPKMNFASSIGYAQFVTQHHNKVPGAFFAYEYNYNFFNNFYIGPKVAFSYGGKEIPDSIPVYINYHYSISSINFNIYYSININKHFADVGSGFSTTFLQYNYYLPNYKVATLERLSIGYNIFFDYKYFMSKWFIGINLSRYYYKFEKLSSVSLTTGIKF